MSCAGNTPLFRAHFQSTRGRRSWDANGTPQSTELQAVLRLPPSEPGFIPDCLFRRCRSRQNIAYNTRKACSGSSKICIFSMFFSPWTGHSCLICARWKSGPSGPRQGNNKMGFSPGFPIRGWRRCPDFGNPHRVEQTFMSAGIRSKK